VVAQASSVLVAMAATLPHEHPLKLLLDLALDHPAEIGRFICLLSVVVRSTARAATCIQRAANRWMLRTRAVRRIQRCLRLRIAQMGASAGRIARAWLGYSRRMLINRSASKIQHGARVMLRRKLSFWTSFLHDLQSAIGCNVEAQLVWDTALNADMGDICLQLLSGLRAVHYAGVIHHAIQPTNIFYCNNETGFRLMIGVSGSSVASALQEEDVFTSDTLSSGAAADIFAAGCVISLIVSGHHIFGLQSKDQNQNISRRSLWNAAGLQRVSYEAFDLVEGMVCRQLVIEECLSHPFFWSTKNRFLYISEVVRTGRHTRLPSGEDLRLGADWRKRLREGGVLRENMARSKASTYSARPSDFLRMIRNFYQHCPHSTDSGREATYLDAAADELKQFPALFIDLHATFGGF